MATIVAIETDGGVSIAGDRRVTSGGTVTSESAERVFDLGDVGAGVVDEAGDAGEFERRLEAELEEAERERRVDVEVLARIAARVAEETGVEAVVATHDDEGIARLRRIDRDGSILSGEAFAFGSGGEIALGLLEGADRSRDLESTEQFAREVVETVAERDPHTGREIDTWALASALGDDR